MLVRRKGCILAFVVMTARLQQFSMSSCLVDVSTDVCIQAGIKQHQPMLTHPAETQFCK